MSHISNVEKVVHVRSYVRRRFERDEDVCEHWRSLPH